MPDVGNVPSSNQSASQQTAPNAITWSASASSFSGTRDHPRFHWIAADREYDRNYLGRTLGGKRDR